MQVDCWIGCKYVMVCFREVNINYMYIHVCKLEKLEKFKKKWRLKKEKSSVVFKDDDCLISTHRNNEEIILNELTYCRTNDVKKSTVEYSIQSNLNGTAIFATDIFLRRLKTINWIHCINPSLWAFKNVRYTRVN